MKEAIQERRRKRRDAARIWMFSPIPTVIPHLNVVALAPGGGMTEPVIFADGL
jgi:hypothetical protein